MNSDDGQSGDTAPPEVTADATAVESTDDPFIIIDDEPEGDEEVASEGAVSADDELDGLRIRHVSRLRRANIRSQSYGIVGVVVCAVAAVKLGLMTHHRYVLRQWNFCGGLSLCAVAAGIAALMFAGYVDRLRDELDVKSAELGHEPDFEPLSDGSHHVTNLEDMR